MFKFIKQYAEKMTGAEIYPIIGFIIFFLFFLVLLYLVIVMRKDRITELSNMPFEADELTNSNT